MSISKPFAGAVSAVAVAALILATPAAAQTQPAAPAPAASGTSDGTTVTIFARRHYSARTAQSEMAREHPEQGCIFKQQNDGRKHSTFTSSVGQASSGGSLLGVGSPTSGDDAQDAAAAAQSPDVADPGAALDELDPCGTNGTLFTDPRNQILAHDKSLDKAFAAYDAGKYDEALPLFKYAWNKSAYDMAALMVGKMYLLGQGTAPDIKQAIYWFKTVVEVARNVTPTARHPEATIEQPFNPALPNYMSSKSEAAMYLARIYENGFKVPKDAKEARKYYMIADDFGFMPATHAVAQMYLNGYGGEINVKEAIKHFVRAGSIGYTPSQYALGEIYYFGEFGVPQDKMMAGAWLLKAAKGGNADAQYAVARMYELGEGGAQVDPVRALAYYKAAAVGGQVDAETTLATYFYTGEGGVQKDLDTARKLFQAAANQGDPEAMFNLGVMMVNGEGGPKDLVRAYCWFYVASQSGLAKAGAAVRELSGKMTPDERAQADALLNPHAGK